MFIAKFPGECDDCDEDIEVGQACEFRGNRVVHAFCPFPTAKVPSKICSVCFTEIPTSGVCGVCD